MRESDQEKLRQVPVFAELPEDACAALTARSMVQRIPRGAIICVQGGMPEHLHIVLSGVVSLQARTEDGEETVVDFFAAGSVVVAPAVMLDAPYLVSAQVVDDAEILFIPAADVRAAMRSQPAFSYAMATQLAAYWRRFIRQIKELKLYSAPERLARYLIELAAEEDGRLSVALPEDRKLVAARLGMTPESLSRAFASLRSLGVEGKGRRITIADAKRLSAFCDYDRPT